MGAARHSRFEKKTLENALCCYIASANSLKYLRNVSANQKVLKTLTVPVTVCYL